MTKKVPLKSKPISLRLSEELYSELCFKAKSLNIENSDFLRQAIIGTAIKSKVDTKSISQCLGKLNHISTTIESIALSLEDANQEHKLSHKTYENLLDILIHIKMQIRNIECMPQ